MRLILWGSPVALVALCVFTVVCAFHATGAFRWLFPLEGLVALAWAAYMVWNNLRRGV